MARFGIADLSYAKRTPQKLSIVMPTFLSVAVQPLIQEVDSEYAMAEHCQRFPQVSAS